jgi:hypothetical protein
MGDNQIGMIERETVRKKNRVLEGEKLLFLRNGEFL